MAKNNIDEHNCNLNVDSYNTDFSEGEHVNEPAKISRLQRAKIAYTTVTRE
jgi:hypothetical protein